MQVNPRCSNVALLSVAQASNPRGRSTDENKHAAVRRGRVHCFLNLAQFARRKVIVAATLLNVQTSFSEDALRWRVEARFVQSSRGIA